MVGEKGTGVVVPELCAVVSAEMFWEGVANHDFGRVLGWGGQS